MLSKEELKKEITDILSKDRSYYYSVELVLMDSMDCIVGKLGHNISGSVAVKDEDLNEKVLELKKRLLDDLPEDNSTALVEYLSIIFDEVVMIREINKKLRSIERIRELVLFD